MTTRNDIERVLWKACDSFRGKIDSSRYKDYILSMLFVKYLSDVTLERRALYMEQYDGDERRVERAMSRERFSLDRESTFDYLYENRTDTEIGQKINVALSHIEDHNSGKLRNVFRAIDFNSQVDFGDVKEKNATLRNLLEDFHDLDLRPGQLGSADIIGDAYEYMIANFASDAGKKGGEFFTPSQVSELVASLVKPRENDRIYDPACGSGGMFVQTGDFVNRAGMIANNAMTFYGQEKTPYNAKLCLMNMAVHGLSGVIRSGDEANTFYHDAHNLCGQCDYVMANPPFNVDKVKAKSTSSAGRLPFGLPGINKNKEIGNANYLWISYFYAYLNDTGRAGFVMASSATDSSQARDKGIREQLIQTGHVDVMMSVGNNFFYTKSLPCSLWFFDKGKPEALLDKVLFIDARNYYTVVDRTLNEWTEWQIKNLTAIVWLYRGEVEHYHQLLADYRAALGSDAPFAEIQTDLEEQLARKRAEAKEAVENAARRDKKAVQAQYNGEISALEDKFAVAKDAVWLYEKFGEGVYQDVPGLCKIESRDVILNEKGASLTPGAYVGVAPVEDDGVDFKTRMAEIHRELLTLQEESNRLMETISKNLEEMEL